MRIPYLRAIGTAAVTLIATAYVGCSSGEPPKEPTQSTIPPVSQSLELRTKTRNQGHLTDPQILDNYRTGDFSFTPDEGANLHLILLEQLDRTKLRKEGILYAKNDNPVRLFYDPDLRVLAHDFNFDGRDGRTGYMRPTRELRDRSITGTQRVRPTFISNSEIYDRGNGKKSIPISIERGVVYGSADASHGVIYGWVDSSHFDTNQNSYIRNRMEAELKTHKSDIQLLERLMREIKGSPTLVHVESFIAEQSEFVRERLRDLGIKGYLDQEPSLEDLEGKVQDLQNAVKLTTQALRN